MDPTITPFGAEGPIGEIKWGGGGCNKGVHKLKAILRKSWSRKMALWLIIIRFESSTEKKSV